MMRAIRWAVVVTLVLPACDDTSTDPTTPAPDPTSAPTSTSASPTSTTTSTSASPTSTTTGEPTIVALVWPPGTVTCAELEGAVPVGVDDLGNPEPGLLEFRWGAGQSASVQYADDPTCSPDTDAWQFLIDTNLRVLFRNPDQCALFQELRESPAPPANLVPVLAVADELCG